MYKQKLLVGTWQKHSKGFAGSLAVIMFFLPTLVFADVLVSDGQVAENNFTTSKFIGTTYHNTLGSAMIINFQALDTTGTGAWILETGLTSTPTTNIASCVAAVSNNCSITGVVPNGSYYKIVQALGTHPSITSWFEWYQTLITISTSTATTSTNTTVDNPNLDLFLGIALFLAGMFFINMFFKRR